MAKTKGLTVTEIRNRRMIYWVDGTADGLAGAELFLYDYAAKKRYVPTAQSWEGNTFHLYLNVESMDNEFPLPSGVYYLGAEDKTGRLVLAMLGKEAEDKRRLAEFAPELVIRKSRKHFLECSSGLDMDTGEFCLSVKTELPEPRKFFLYSELRKWGGGIFRDIKDILVSCFVLAFNVMNRLCRKRGDRVLFASGSRAEIGGNEKFIYDKLVEMGLDRKYRITFDFKPTIHKTYDPFRMLRFIYRLASSDIILVDDYYPEIYKVKYDEGVKVVQVWHACGAFKTVGLERMAKPFAPALNSEHHKCYTHVLVSSDHSALHNQEAFGIDLSKFHATGVPRTDIFFDEAYREKTLRELHEVFPRAKDAKQVILYAPTFRVDAKNLEYFPMDKFALAEWGEMCRRTGSYLIVKMHPFVTEPIAIPEEYADVIADAASYREVNDLLFLADVMVTDYSSIIYEFSLLRRPMLFYAFDLNMYLADRDFYENYEDIVPGPIVKRFDELLRRLEERDYDTGKLDAFIAKNFKQMDGRSSERAVRLIFGDGPEKKD